MLSIHTEICVRSVDCTRANQVSWTCLREERVVVRESVNLVNVVARLANVEDRLDVRIDEPKMVLDSVGIKTRDTNLRQYPSAYTSNSQL